MKLSDGTEKPVLTLLFFLLLGLLPAAALPARAEGVPKGDEEVEAQLAKTQQSPPDIQPPGQLLRVKADVLKKMLQQKPSKERTRRIKDLADSLIVYDVLAQRSLGDKQWGVLQVAQQKEFVGLLRALIEKNYVEQTEKNPEFGLKWGEEEMGKLGDKARIVVLASAQGDALELECRMMLLPRGWVVYDLLVDGVSMTRNYHKTFRRIIERDGWEGLIQRMKKKLAGAKDDELDGGATEGRKARARAGN